MATVRAVRGSFMESEPERRMSRRTSESAFEGVDLAVLGNGD